MSRVPPLPLPSLALGAALLAPLPGCVVTDMGCGDPACEEPCKSHGGSPDGVTTDPNGDTGAGDTGGGPLVDEGGALTWTLSPAAGPAGERVAVDLRPSAIPEVRPVGLRVGGGVVVCAASPAGGGLDLELGLPGAALPGAVDVWVDLEDGGELHLPAAFEVEPGDGGLVTGDPCASG